MCDSLIRLKLLRVIKLSIGRKSDFKYYEHLIGSQVP